MKKFIIYFLSLIAFFTISISNAKEMQLKQTALQRFYSGYVIGGELSYSPVTLVNKTKTYEFESYRNPVYLAIFVQYDKNRSTSIYDYSVIIAGKSFDCLAIKEGDGFFDVNNKIFKKTHHNKIYTMLFIVDWPIPKKQTGSKAELELNYNLSYQEPIIKTKVKFSNLKDEIISEPGKFLKDKVNVKK